MNVIKHISPRFILRIPSPPLPRGLKSKILGHLAPMIDVTVKNKQNVGMGIMHLRENWYKQTKSKTIMVRIFFKTQIITCDPEIYKEILVQKQDHFNNGTDFKRISAYFFKNSIIVADGEQWQRIRKIIQRAINKQSLDAVIPIMCDTTKKMFTCTDVNNKPTETLVYRLTFDVFHRVMYGWNPKSVEFSQESSQILDCCVKIADTIGKRLYSLPFQWKLPTKDNRIVDKAAVTIREFIIKFIAEQRQKLSNRLISDRKDTPITLLDSMIISADSGEDGGMTNEELIDQIASLFFGAFDTASNTILFLLNYLSRYPEVQEKLRKEIMNKFPLGIESLEKATLNEIESIHYLGYFIDEVNRLNALAPFIMRDCIKDTVIGDYEIRKGTSILVDTNAVGQDPSYWNGMKDLDKFRPERWEEHTPNKLNTVLPFGFGGRICPGKKIAICEMKVFISYILCKYQVRLRNPNEELELDMVLGINIKHSNGNINFIPLDQK